MDSQQQSEQSVSEMSNQMLNGNKLGGNAKTAGKQQLLGLSRNHKYERESI